MPPAGGVAVQGDPAAELRDGTRGAVDEGDSFAAAPELPLSPPPLDWLCCCRSSRIPPPEAAVGVVEGGGGPLRCGGVTEGGLSLPEAPPLALDMASSLGS